MNAQSGQVCDAVHNMALDLSDWSRNVLGDLEKRIKKARQMLEACRWGPISDSSTSRLELLKFKLERLEEQKNLYWWQKAIVHWLENGDRNTNFPPQYTSERRRSRVRRIVLDDGRVVEDEKEMLRLVSNFY